MPKYSFECSHCQVHFTRSLAMGEHPTHPCPSCKTPAPRLWMGQGFGFDFTGPQTGSTANTGVSKIDNPTADQAVGASAATRWAEYAARDKVKEEVRAQSGQKALVRQDGTNFIDYHSGNEKLIEARKKAGKTIDAAIDQGVKSVNKEFEKAEQKAR